jgi:hypothetical protein
MLYFYEIFIETIISILSGKTFRYLSKVSIINQSKRIIISDN